jgi:hypothetical protein
MCMQTCRSVGATARAHVQFDTLSATVQKPSVYHMGMHHTPASTMGRAAVVLLECGLQPAHCAADA